MSDIAVLITYTMDDQINRILLDTIDDVSIQSNSTITTYPIVSGDMLADHMYKNPTTMSIPGQFSMNSGSATTLSSDYSKLVSFQTLFERIKNEGILCNIVKVSINDNQIRFLARDSMALSGITWTERINTVRFNFEFVEVLVADVIDNPVDVNDEYLPSIVEPPTVSFTQTILDWTQVDVYVHSLCSAWGIISKNFLEYLQTAAADAIVVGGSTVVGAGALASVAGVIALVAGAPILPVVAAAGAVVGGITLAYSVVKTLSTTMKNGKYTKNQFDLYADDRRNQYEVERYGSFLSNIHKQIANLDEVVTVWDVGEAKEQTATILIDNNYYKFIFTKNNTTNTHDVFVENIYETEIARKTNIETSPSSFVDCPNSLFRAAETGRYIYILQIENEDTNKPNYYILASGIKGTDFSNALEEIVDNALGV